MGSTTPPYETSSPISVFRNQFRNENVAVLSKRQANNNKPPSEAPGHKFGMAAQEAATTLLLQGNKVFNEIGKFTKGKIAAETRGHHGCRLVIALFDLT